MDLSVEQWQKVIGINLTGPFLMMKAAIPEMIKNGGGSIINIASLAGLRCIPAMPAYSASKSGLIGLSQATALDYGAQKIRVNVVAPGPIRTEMLEHSMQGLADATKTDITGALNTLTKFLPLKRPAMPEESAGTVVPRKDDASYITGIVVPSRAAPASSTPAAPRSLPPASAGDKKGIISLHKSNRPAGVPRRAIIFG